MSRMIEHTILVWIKEIRKLKQDWWTFEDQKYPASKFFKSGSESLHFSVRPSAVRVLGLYPENIM